MGAIFVLGVIVEMVAKDWRHWLVAKMLLGWGQGICQATTMTVSTILSCWVNGADPTVYLGDRPHSDSRFSHEHLWVGICYWPTSFCHCPEYRQHCKCIPITRLTQVVSNEYSRQTDPENYLKGIYSEWVPLGIFLLLVVFIPESPWFYARHEKEEQAKKTLTRVFGNVNGYDAEGEYAAMVAEIQHERQRAELNSQSAWRDLFSGTNTVRYCRCGRDRDCDRLTSYRNELLLV